MIENAALLLCLALALDAVMGEPDGIWRRVAHPAVLMGRMIAWADRRFNSGEDARAQGIAVIFVFSLTMLILGALIAALPLGWLWSLLGAAVLLAQKSLVDHVKAVSEALFLSLDEGRVAVAKIVGRDTKEMEESDVARAAIESAAENFSDGVIAPAFWFLILGLPGILLYKLVNTADSMIGHRTPRHEEFGWAAARLDDVLNYIPARLTAGLFVLAGLAPRAIAVVLADARSHQSPNAGYPEAAMAGVMDIALGGPRRYGGEMTDLPFFNEAGRKALTRGDIDIAVGLLWRAWAVFLALILALAAVL